MKRYLTLLLFVFLILPPHLVLGQFQPLLNQEHSGLMHLADTLKDDYLQRRHHALERARALGLPVVYQMEDGNLMELQYFDKQGLPVYFGTRNAEAARSVGTSQLQELGILGLFLGGRKMVAGVWDGGAVEPSHNEFGTRVSVRDGASISNHATHVAGTMIARGNNASSRGMAPEASVRSYDWNNDLSEMAAEAANGLLLSNHSYGVVLGWNWNSSTNNWQWMAHADSTRDYRFGFYSNLSRSLDQIAYQAPHYLIVWAAGNDRNDTGNGSRPGDGPYDIIGPEGVAKNVLTVGAVQKLNGPYSGPQSVRMSLFSSWGPADDGRIKPDLVGVGVQLTSTISGNGYATYSGTSMASPNVSGSLLLLQQLYHQTNARYMRAATLKGLAIHTCREAGLNDGPDYQHGWGLLDAEKAARMIIYQDDVDLFIREESLQDGQKFAMEFQADGSGEIIATLSWTDPPATPVAPAMNPTDRMLVNDLDVRIINKQTQEVFYPWTLDGKSPEAPAKPGDNILDNVERINIKAPAPGIYILEISHKGELQNGQQDFSLLLQSRQIPERKTLYWVGNSGFWNDPGNWSLVSGGTPAGFIPGKDDRLIFDSKSFAGSKDIPVVKLQDNTAAYSFQYFSPQPARIEADGNTLEVNGTFYIDPAAELTLHDLTLRLTGDKNHYVFSTGENQPSSFSIVFDGKGVWTGLHTISAGNLLFESGDLTAPNINLFAKEIVTAENYSGYLNLSGASINGLQTLKFLSSVGSVDASGSVIAFGKPQSPPQQFLVEAPGHTLHQLISQEGQLLVIGDHSFASLTAGESFYLMGNNIFGKLEILPGTAMKLAPGSVQSITGPLQISSNQAEPVSILSQGSQNARIEVLSYQKLCFDYLTIQQVDISGEALIAAGINSQADESSMGWLMVDCQDLLYPAFSYSYACAGGLTFLTDESSGKIDSWLWGIHLEDGILTQNRQHASASFPKAGIYNVSLNISNEHETREVSKEVTVRENTFTAGQISLEGNTYTSQNTAVYYQWYLDGEPIPNAIFRSFENENGLTGNFQVLLYNNVCNILSQPLVVVSTNDLQGPNERLQLYPNPALRQVNILTGQEAARFPWLHVSISDLAGRLLFSEVFQNHNQGIRINNLNLPAGMYVISVHYGTFSRSEKLMIAP